MQRKPGFPVANCSIKMPDCTTLPDLMLPDDDTEQQQRRQQLINFGHSQWGFNNWSWSVSKQELDFVDFSNGKYCAGVVAFVSITVKSFDIHRENIGYATSVANSKGFAIYKSRKCAVTNALRETLMSFGGTVASELCEVLEMHRGDTPANAEHSENNQNVANKPCEPRNVTLERAARNESEPTVHPALRSPLAPPPSSAPPASIAPPACSAPPAVKNAPGARTLPGALPPANRVAPAPRAAPVPAAPAHAPHTPAPAHAPHTPAPAHVPHAPPPHARHNSNDLKSGMEGLSEEEARAERKRRQRQAQEEFRLKQLVKQQGLDDKHELSRNSSSFDKLLMDIPTQDIMIEATGEEPAKRKSPAPDANASAAKRRSTCLSKLDIVQAE